MYLEVAELDANGNRQTIHRFDAALCVSKHQATPDYRRRVVVDYEPVGEPDGPDVISEEICGAPMIIPPDYDGPHGVEIIHVEC